MRYFMEKDSEYTYDLNYFKDMIIEENIEKLELLEMKRDYGGEMWCDENQNFVEKGEDCGIQCPLYSPCNGKSGRCRSLKNGFVETGREFILTKFGLKEKK
jgi:hypothetical protein